MCQLSPEKQFQFEHINSKRTEYGRRCKARGEWSKGIKQEEIKFDWARRGGVRVRVRGRRGQMMVSEAIGPCGWGPLKAL